MSTRWNRISQGLRGVGVAACALCAACDGDGAASSGDLDQYCAANCDWKTRCSKGSSECVSKCVGDGGKTIALFRHTFIAEAARCYGTLPCAQKDDDCVAAGTRAVVSEPTSSPDFQQCTAARKVCQDAGNPAFSDDYCSTAVVVIDRVQDALAACYQKPCEAMEGCIKAILPIEDDS